MLLKAGKKSIGRLLALVMAISVMMCIPAQAATTVNVLDGQVTVTDSLGNGSVSGGAVTISAQGGLTGLARKTNEITVTNASSEEATLTFVFTASTYSSFTDPNGGSSASGTYSGKLAAGGTVSMSITGPKNYSTAQLVLSSFSLVPVQENPKVTVEFDSTLGSVTVAGTAAASGTKTEIGSGVEVVATAKSGNTFFGWVDKSTNMVLSTSATYTVTAAADITVKPIFGNTTKACFGVGDASQQSVSSGFMGMGSLDYYTVGTSYIFDDLNAAATAAQKGTSKYIVLLNTATLPAGTYTIPSGVTLLIPFDDANTMYTTQIQTVSAKDDYESPTKYRTLTMASGANLILNGSMSISAKQCYAQGAQLNGGSPTGKVGFVQMQGTSSITVNSGGTLYAYGYISGSGSVTANSGATIYECFQFMDFRGGSQTTEGAMEDNEIFPLSQYYVQNIEVPMTIYSGATEYAYTTVYMSGSEFGTAVEFVGDNGMFKLTEGHAVKTYDGATDRLNIELHGTADISSVTLDFGTSKIDSADYDLPLTNNITVKVMSGSAANITQDMALLPGSEIVVESDAECTLGTDNNINNIYVYDKDQWGNYCGAGNKYFIPVTYAPGRTYTRTATDLVDAKIVVNGTVDASGGYIYTTESGANICSDGGGVVKTTEGTQTVTYQVKQASEASDSTYPEIPITTAMLKNADETYVKSATDAYTYTNGRWTPTTDVYASTGNVYYHYDDLGAAVTATATDSASTVYVYEASTLDTLDLFGRDFKVGGAGSIAVTTIYDSKTDAYNSAAAGSIELTTAPAGLYTNDTKHYVSILNENGAYEFHRVAASFNACRIARIQGVYYMTVQGNFRASDLTISKLNDLGLTMGFIFVDEAVHYDAEGKAVTFGSAIDYDGDENATKESLYVLNSGIDSSLAYAAPTGLYGKYLPINYTFVTSETGEHNVLCRVNLNGKTFDSTAHLIEVGTATLTAQ